MAASKPKTKAEKEAEKKMKAIEAAKKKKITKNCKCGTETRTDY